MQHIVLHVGLAGVAVAADIEDPFFLLFRHIHFDPLVKLLTHAVRLEHHLHCGLTIGRNLPTGGNIDDCLRRVRVPDSCARALQDEIYFEIADILDCQSPLR